MSTRTYRIGWFPIALIVFIVLATIADVLRAEVMRVRVAKEVKARTPTGIYINLPAGTEIGACETNTHIVIGYNAAARAVVVEEPCDIPPPALLRDGFEQQPTVTKD
jgi:hypothetical protein